MSNPVLTKILQSNNPSAIQKYVKNRLPNNPESLQKIYSDLATFSETLNGIFQGKNQEGKIGQLAFSKTSQIKGFNTKVNQQAAKRHKSFKDLPKRVPQDYFERNKQENITKRQQSLIRSLKERGLRGNSSQVSFGLEIINKEQQKISKPLQFNEIAQLKGSTSDLTKCIKRFNLNPHFYTNSIADGHIDEQMYYDKEMKRFLDMRSSSLKKLKNKEEFENDVRLMNSRKFPHVESLLFKKTGSTLGLETMRSSVRSQLSDLPPEKKLKVKQLQEYNNEKLIQTQELINHCIDTLQITPQSRPKSLLYETKKYQTLRQKTQSITSHMAKMQERLQFDGMELQNQSEEINQMAKSLGDNGLIDKYTLNYMKFITNRPTHETVKANRKDLIKNEAKFRKLIVDKGR